LVALTDEQKKAKEVIASAETRLKLLDAYGKSLDKKRGVDIEGCLEIYRTEREKVFLDHMHGTARDRELAKEIGKLQREERRLKKLEAKEEEKAAKEKAKVQRAKSKLKEKQRRREEERRKEKTRIRREREQFWPRCCYSVRISLDATNFTPGSSRRSSIASLADVKMISEKDCNSPTEDGATLTCDLSLSYVTSSAFWSPSYDLALSTTTNTATLCFDAQLTNMTSETWSNSKVILSTSQATFSGLQDDVPNLVPWRLKLVGRGAPWDGVDIVHSREERNQKEVYNAAQNALGLQKPRAALFGVGNSLSQYYDPQFNQTQQQMLSKLAMNMTSAPIMMQQTMQRQMAPQAQQAQQGALLGSNTGFGNPSFGQQHSSNIGFSNVVGGGGLFGQQHIQMERTNPQPSLFGTLPGGAASNVNVPSAGGLFGNSSSNANTSSGSGLFGSRVSNANTAPAGASFGSSTSNANVGTGGSLFGGNTSNADWARSGGLFAGLGANARTDEAAEAAKPAPPSMSTAVKKSRASGISGEQLRANYESEPAGEDEDDEENDGQTMLEPTPEVAFQESSFEETGLTATYDVPNLKTLKPSSTASKQRVARISFANVVFSRTVVAKYKPAAYLKARLRNTSKLTLLRGPTGLTLDGTFMGRSTLPRCSAGDSFNMPLGVDPAIKVAYPKPDVTRSTTGVFSKGENSVYTRSVTLVNTRAAAGKPVTITVLDQVPVSEDEKLRVEVLHPPGLSSTLTSGKPVATGVPGKDTDKDWGKATAVLKKAGEVSWDVVLNAGKSVKLLLQYEVAFPTGERVAQC
jgi:hypothetical protein